MFKTVSQDIRRERLSTCQPCEYFNASANTCKKCGCYMPAKASFAQSSCPAGKWNKETHGNSLINTIEESILKMWNKQ